MKKKLIGFGFAAVMSAAMAMNAFAGEVTVDDVLAGYAEASKNAREATAVVEGKADAVITVEEQGSMTINGNADMNVAFSLDPFQIYTDAVMNGKMEMMGQEMGGEIAMTVYGVPEEDGTTTMYAGMNEGQGMEWFKTAMPAEAMDMMKSMMENVNFSPADLPIEFTLSDELKDVNGTECYVLNTTLTWEDVMNCYSVVLEKVSEMLPEEAKAQLPDADTLNMAGAMLSGLQFNMEMDVAADTYLPMYLHIDLEGSDWVTLGAVIASMTGAQGEDGSLPSISLDVNELYLDYTYDYTTPVEVTVPDDVIAQAVDEGGVEDLTTDFVEELESEM